MYTALRRFKPFFRDLVEKRTALIGAVLVVLFILTGLLAPMLAPHPPNRINLRRSLETPSLEYPFGTDNHGRCVFSRVLHGARLSLYVAVASIVTALVIGVFFGLLAGYFSSLQAPIMRIVDVMLAFPGIIVALIVIAILGTGINNVVFAIAISRIPQFVRLVNGSVLSVREALYVEAARATGETDGSIIARYILPNCFGPIMVQTSLMIPAAIMTAASLSFLGLGVQPPQAEWGAMINLGREWMQAAPHVIYAPGFSLVAVVLGFNLLGDGLRDILDPTLRRG